MDFNKIAQELKEEYDFYEINHEHRFLDLEFYPHFTAGTEEEYCIITDALDKNSVSRKKYRVYCWYDVSGFDYWVNQMEESNYISITIDIKSNLTKEEYISLLYDINCVVSKAEKIATII